MGRIVTITNFERAMRENDSRVSDVTFDHGGGANLTGEHFSSPGDDSYPRLTDYAFIVHNSRQGGYSIVGYADAINTPKALIGDKRIYSRDASGAGIGEVWLKADGSILVNNPNGSIELKADGSADINGVTIDPSGNVIIPGTLSINGIDFGTHIHSQANDGGGDSQANTGVPL